MGLEVRNMSCVFGISYPFPVPQFPQSHKVRLDPFEIGR